MAGECRGGYGARGDMAPASVCFGVRTCHSYNLAGEMISYLAPLTLTITRCCCVERFRVLAAL